MLVYQRVLDGQKQDLSNLPSMYSILDSTLKWDVELPLWHNGRMFSQRVGRCWVAGMIGIIQ